MSNTITAALGLGESFALRSEETIQVFPARFAQLEKSMKLYADVRMTIVQSMYLPGNEQQKESFESLLLLANGQGNILDDKEKRPTAIEAILEKFGQIDDGGEEIRKYIDRFLGLVEPNTGAKAEEK